MTQTATDIIIVGAGIAGLAAGCYAQMQGYQTQIFELHDQPGGLCTAWERQGYVFDGCLYYLFGTGEGQPFYRLWEELGAIQGKQFIHHNELMHIRSGDGRTLVVYSDPDRLEAHLKQVSPIDSLLIEDFCDGIRALTQFDLSLLLQQPRTLMKSGDWGRLGLKLLPFAGTFLNWGNLSAQEFANRFEDPFLRRAIAQMFSWSSIPVMVGMSLLAYTHNQNAGVPLGGSLEFARSIARRYLELGGTIHYHSLVKQVLVKDHQAVGVRLHTQEDFYASRVIAACDGKEVLFQLLPDQPIERSLKQLYDGRVPIHTQIQVSLGVNQDFSEEPHWVTHLLDQPVTIAGKPCHEISVKHYCFDPSLAPSGKSVLIVMLPHSYDYWQQIAGQSLYHVEKSQAGHQVIDLLEQFYPGLKSKIECVDVSTPLTYERYTGNWQGSNCGWLLTKQALKLMIKGLPKTLPNLKRFYMIGQWVEPGGGVPIVAMSGRTIIQQICHEDHQEFVPQKAL